MPVTLAEVQQLAEQLTPAEQAQLIAHLARRLAETTLIEFPPIPGYSTEEVRSLAREALAVKLYAQGSVSAGWAAQALGISRRAFLDLLGAYRVPEFDDQIDVAAEARHE